MTKNAVWQLVIFAVVCVSLNMFFHLHISIIGSLLLTLGLAFASRYTQS
ncbi:hypothetical protein [Novipirellula rosea]